MAYPPQQQQPLTRQQRFDEQDKADQEFANQQQALRIQQQRADADEENQAAQQQRIQFERQRLPLDLYSAQAQAEAQRANAQFQQQQQAEQLRTAPQREQQGAATLAATQQGIKDAIAAADRAATTFNNVQTDRPIILAGEAQKQANAQAEADRAATMGRIQQQENKRAQETANRQQRAEVGATALNAANIAHANATTAATKSAANNVILRNYFDSGAITPHQYAYLNTVPLEDQMAYAEDMMIPKAGAGASTSTSAIAAKIASADETLTALTLSEFSKKFGISPDSSLGAQVKFKEMLEARKKAATDTQILDQTIQKAEQAKNRAALPEVPDPFKQAQKEAEARFKALSWADKEAYYKDHYDERPVWNIFNPHSQFVNPRSIPGHPNIINPADIR